MTQIKKHYGRILEISDDHKQITLPDGRYYQRNGEYYPSVTYVLSHYPKGKFFEDWLKKVGYSADYMVVLCMLLIFGKCFYALLIFGKNINLL